MQIELIAKRAGEKACFAGFSRENNPYPANTSQSEHWFAGFDEAQFVREQLKESL